MLLALLALIGPHAAEAALHASDAEAAWVRAAPVEQPLLAMTAPIVTKRVYGYLPYWGSIDLSTFHWELVTDVVTFSAGLGTDGTVSNTHALPGSALLSAAHSHGVRVHVCATLFNSSGGSEIATFLASSAARSKAISQLVSLVSGADGINLDFEFVPGTSRDAFTSFVTQLHTAMPAGTELTIAMPASTGYSGYDAAKLAANTERLLLMEYDYHWSSAPTAGPNAPLTKGGFWSSAVEDAVTGFLSVAPASSLAMGVPYYGYDWATTSGSPGASTTSTGTTVLFKNVFTQFTTYGRLWDAPSQTPWFKYSGHQGWADDDQSLALKYGFVNNKGLAGVMIWALSYDSGRTEAWDALKTAFAPVTAGPGVLQIVSATVGPAQVNPGELVTAEVVVKNTGGQDIGTVAPPPDTIYDETQSSTGSISGTWRIALDVADRPAAQQAHPWRWGLAAPLAPGAQTTFHAQVRMERAGLRTIYAAVIHEGVDVPQDNVGATQVQVGAPPVDAGTTDADGGATPAPPESVPHGCTHAGAAWLALAGLLVLRRKRQAWWRGT